MAHIEYPGLPVEYVMEMVHKFYDEYYFRPKAAFRVVWQAIVNRDVPRLYTEAKVLHGAPFQAQQGRPRRQGSQRRQGPGIRQHERVTIQYPQSI